jgi:hypothetical protein
VAKHPPKQQKQGGKASAQSDTTNMMAAAKHPPEQAINGSKVFASVERGSQASARRR